MGALANLVGSAGGAIVGNIAAQGDQDKATAAREAALKQILGVDVPTIDEQKWNLAKQAVQGTYDPSMEGTVALDPSHMGGISTDPRLAQAQMNALSSLEQEGRGGLTSIDRMNLMNIRNQSSGDANAASQAIMQNMAARGMGGGGGELAARLIASQGAANRGAQSGMEVAAQSQQKALQALSQAGALGGQIRAQGFGEGAQKAQAQDAIDKFNAANRQQVMGSNTQAQNQAQLSNLANAQNVANANVASANRQEEHNKGLYQNQFGNQMQKAGAAAGQYNTNSGYYGGQAEGTRGMWAGIGDSLGQAASGQGSKSKSKPSGGVDSGAPTYGSAIAGGQGESDPLGSLLGSGAINMALV